MIRADTILRRALVAVALFGQLAPATASDPRQAEMDAIIARLCEANRYESESVGGAGVPSELNASFRRLTELARPSELRALLHHPSPVLRYWVGEYYVKTFPQRAADVAHLLLDPARVPTTHGCIVDTGNVAEIVVFRLCERAGVPEVKRVLLQALEDPAVFAVPSLGGLNVVGGSILRCLAPDHPPRVEVLARVIVITAIAHDGPPEPFATTLLPSALTALANYREPKDELLFVSLLRHRDGYVRAASAFGLGMLKPQSAARRLRPLLKDETCYARTAAAGALTSLPTVRDAEITRMLRGRDCVAEGAGAALAANPSPRALRLLRPYLLANAPGHFDTMSKLAEVHSPEVRALMTELLQSRDTLVVGHAREYLEQDTGAIDNEHGSPDSSGTRLH